jgi:hypothetical protein
MSFDRPRYPRTKIKHLVALGGTLDMAVKRAISRKKYGRMTGTAAIRFAMTNEWLCVSSLRATRLGVIQATLVRGFSSRNRTVLLGASADPHARWCGGCRQQGRRLPDLARIYTSPIASRSRIRSGSLNLRIVEVVSPIGVNGRISKLTNRKCSNQLSVRGL